jgi:hypothetical protein
MYACVCVCMYAYTYIYMYVYMYMYACVCIYMWMYVCMYVPHLTFESAGRDTRCRRYDGGRSRHAEHHRLEMRLTYDGTDCRNPKHPLTAGVVVR